MERYSPQRVLRFQITFHFLDQDGNKIGNVIYTYFEERDSAVKGVIVLEEHLVKA
jgi:hypothetical protein